MTYGKTYRGEELRAYRLSAYGLKDLEPVVDDKDLNALMFYVPADEIPVAIGFSGNRKRPDFYLRFHSKERRDEYCGEWLENLRARAASKEAEKAKRLAGHSLVVGAILTGSWGYDETHVEWYEVTKLCGKTMVEIRKIRGRTESTDSVGNLRVMPGTGEDRFIGEPLRKRVDARYNSVRMASYLSLSPWRGKPKYETGPYNGH